MLKNMIRLMEEKVFQEIRQTPFAEDEGTAGVQDPDVSHCQGTGGWAALHYNEG